MSERQRLDKVLAHVGYGTRKEVKRLVRDQRIRVNEDVACDPGMHVTPHTDEIVVDGERVVYREHIYLMMNKPQGVLSATEDVSDPVVTDLLQLEHQVLLPFPVGRLDKDTEGLLLLTNDGKLSHQLLSPKKHVPKRYFARIQGIVDETDQNAIANGIVLDDGYRALPGELTILHSGPESEIEITIYEGKFHQVKRMFAAIDKSVVYLKRLAMGPLELDENLELGEYRELTAVEISLLHDANRNG